MFPRSLIAFPSPLGLAVLAFGATVFLVPTASAQTPSGPPFADGPDKPKLAPKPKSRNWTVVKKGFTYQFGFAPGIPAVGEVARIDMSGLEKPPVPHPKWGSTVPMTVSRLVAAVITPAGEIAQRYVMHPVPLENGKYAIHFTPTEKGIHTLKVEGKLADGRAVGAEVKVPVDVWPLPKDLEGTGDAGGAVRRRVVRKPITN